MMPHVYVTTSHFGYRRIKTCPKRSQSPLETTPQLLSSTGTTPQLLNSSAPPGTTPQLLSTRDHSQLLSVTRLTPSFPSRPSNTSPRLTRIAASPPRRRGVYARQRCTICLTMRPPNAASQTPAFGGRFWSANRSDGGRLAPSIGQRSPSRTMRSGRTKGGPPEHTDVVGPEVDASWRRLATWWVEGGVWSGRGLG